MLENSTGQNDNSCIFVIFGGTGDLTRRKLIPALYSLFHSQALPGNLAVVSIGRRDKNDDIYISEMYDAVRKFSRFNASDESWADFSRRVFYRQFDFSGDVKGYSDLKDFLSQLDTQFGTSGNRIFFLAVAPEYFSTIIENLNYQGMLEKGSPWKRVMIEKPFGSSLSSAKILNRSISRILDEESIFRIDHYLGKEMIQNITTVRFGNSLFEPLWNHQYIDNVQITSSETLGVESRGLYYESAGILKDMLQNHLLQMLALVAMEPPVRLEPEYIRDEKVKVLHSLRLFDESSMMSDVVRGQYGEGHTNGRKVPGYRDEERVSRDSNTETFIAVKVYIDNFRWGGVPFYIRSGKRLNKKTTEIVIQFKNLPGISLYKEFKDSGPNLLVFKIQPREGFFFQINAKRPSSDFMTEAVRMDYCQSCRVDKNSPEAYERLILECIKNNSALFTRLDELELSWAFTDSIEQIWKNTPTFFPNYAAGSSGPEEAFELIRRDERTWWDTGI